MRTRHVILSGLLLSVMIVSCEDSSEASPPVCGVGEDEDKGSAIFNQHCTSCHHRMNSRNFTPPSAREIRAMTPSDRNAAFQKMETDSMHRFIMPYITKDRWQLLKKYLGS